MERVSIQSDWSCYCIPGGVNRQPRWHAEPLVQCDGARGNCSLERANPPTTSVVCPWHLHLVCVWIAGQA
eukprot:1998559-Amphidinium_carterae.1